ncbi:DDR2 [Lepeophtheirus salmonis]|uniref:DDR2 n=1 Tax=Lepeophtheirus salmonis TaxID=72036 RepID=A0A7R8D5F2_LEPSM|nr:DDR2 [Lepeophtheirus salmonis]CAF3034867.1 DDR2 [Lepeophtheirus salmonis]
MGIDQWFPNGFPSSPGAMGKTVLESKFAQCSRIDWGPALSGLSSTGSSSTPPTTEVSSVSNEANECAIPLGMEHGHIDDADITASSAFDFKSVGPQNGRINKDQYGGAWCPLEAVAKTAHEWIEIDMHKDYRITQTGTQGRYGGGRGQEFTEMFIFQYWRTGMKDWVVYRNHSGHEILPGNKNTYVVNINKLNPPIVASKVRFVPYSHHPRTVCMRVEVYGCVYETGLKSYSTPPGDEFSPHVYLSDVYDGEEKSRNGRMENGLGVLTDGVIGGNISYSQHGIKSAPGWVGWKNRKRDVVLIFEFNTLRKFESITFVTHANKDMGIQPFSHMVASFSESGNRYNSNRLTKPNKRAALELSEIDSVTLSLDGQLGKFIKLQLFFTDKWILLSEISFDSSPISTEFNSSSSSIPYISEEEETIDSKPDDSNDVRNTPRNEFPVEFRGDESVLRGGSIEEEKDTSSPTQVYIGLIIGVLGVTVLLLLVTIAVMMRRNKQKIFNKHSLFKSPNLTPNGRLHHPSYAAAPLPNSGIITLRDLKQQQPSGHVTAQMYGSPPHHDDSDEGSSYYHEPYRLILKPTNNKPINSNSCGRLCEYEEFGLLQEQQQMQTVKLQQQPLLKTSLDKSNGNSIGGGPAGSFKSNGYATTDFVKKWHPPPPPLPIPNNVSTNKESFYAATDILTGDRTKDEDDETVDIGNYLKGNTFTPMMMTRTSSSSDESDFNIPEFSRRNLRMIEKLGEGNFGMAHLCETASLKILPQLHKSHRRRCRSYSKGSHPLLNDLSYMDESDNDEEELEDKNVLSESTSVSDSELSEDGRRVVVVRSLWKPTSEYRREEFFESVRRQSVLKGCSNIAHILAICTQDEPICVLSEYLDLGDLRQFLKTRRYSVSSSPDSSTLLYIAAQISSGMKYLEKLGYVHRDLAARNCLIDYKYNIKISDFAMFRPIYAKDYYQIEDSKEILSLRWIPWEVYIMDPTKSLGAHAKNLNVSCTPVFENVKKVGWIVHDQVAKASLHSRHEDGQSSTFLGPLNKLKSASPGIVILSSNKNTFDVDSVYNRLNDHYASFQEINEHLRTVTSSNIHGTRDRCLQWYFGVP